MKHKTILKLILRMLNRFGEKQTNKFKLTKNDEMTMNIFLDSLSMIIYGKNSLLAY
jgi:hypothetical protein